MNSYLIKLSCCFVISALVLAACSPAAQAPDTPTPAPTLTSAPTTAPTTVPATEASTPAPAPTSAPSAAEPTSASTPTTTATVAEPTQPVAEATMAATQITTGSLVSKYAAAQLNGSTGHVISDTRTARVGEDRPNFMVWGPGEPLQPGSYLALFRLRVDSSVPLTATDTVATLDVADDLGERILAKKALSVKSFAQQGEWQVFDLPFQLSQPGKIIEYRVYWLGTADLSVSGVEVTKVDGSK